MFTAEEIEETLAKYRPWAEVKARSFPGHPQDDLIQEALIAMWKELLKYDPDKGIPLDYILKRRATWRIQDVAMGRKPFLSSETGRRRNRLKDPTPMDPFQLQVLDSYGEQVPADDDCSFHRDEIISSIREVLTPEQAEYAIMKFGYQVPADELPPGRQYRSFPRRGQVQMSLYKLAGLVSGNSES